MSWIEREWARTAVGVVVTSAAFLVYIRAGAPGAVSAPPSTDSSVVQETKSELKCPMPSLKAIEPPSPGVRAATSVESSAGTVTAATTLTTPGMAGIPADVVFSQEYEPVDAPPEAVANLQPSAESSGAFQEISPSEIPESLRWTQKDFDSR